MLVIKNGRVVDPVTGIDQMLDLVIEDQKIVKLLKPDETVLYEKENPREALFYQNRLINEEITRKREELKLNQ